MSNEEKTTDPSDQRPTRTSSRRSVVKAVGVGAASGLVSGTGTAEDDVEDGAPPRLRVDGNRFVTPDGESVTLRGVNTIDPKRANVTAPARGKNAIETVELLTDADRSWHPDVIRVPVQPTDIGEHRTGEPADPVAFTGAELRTYLDSHLDPVIDLLAERGMYAIVDFHRHWAGLNWGNEEEGTVNQSLRDEAVLFWEVVARRYGEADHVLFEAYNEPTMPGMWGPIGRDRVDDVWDLFLEFMQPIVDEIREHTDAVTLVGSPGWTTSPEGALIEPIASENIAYTYHIYPGHEASKAGDWDDSSNNGQGVEAVYEEYPLFVTEFGWREYDDDLLSGSTEAFGRPFVEWMESHDSIHWTAWCADVWWEPAMFETGFDIPDGNVDDPYEEDVPVACEDRPCEWTLLGADGGSDGDSGAFIRRALAADGVPEASIDEGRTDESRTDEGRTDESQTDESRTDENDDTTGAAGVEPNDPPESDGGDETAATEDLPGFGLVTGATGVAVGVAYAIRQRMDSTEANGAE